MFVTDLEEDADVAGKFGEEAKVGYARCDVSSREQVEGEEGHLHSADDEIPGE